MSLVIKRLLEPIGIVSVLILLIFEVNKFELLLIFKFKLLIFSLILALFIYTSLLFILPLTSNL